MGLRSPTFIRDPAFNRSFLVRAFVARPVAMGKGEWNDADHTNLPVYTWKEVGEHKERDDRWIVINGYVYDVTSWAKRHPGGEKIIGGYAGHDASVSMIFIMCCISSSSSLSLILNQAKQPI